ncbi:hypothetical protein HYFRA_00011386 [Hymenoscyphus fraxineus]|uniref:Uncharacterized protein n=1 Tax=Hymenoscyphus fraxineus TaxID=746836 RepID=A0A9N9L465_9HELO|nr:hypothetical protein HYFRA_00011386 [Hymenoscyphus fraxineus]
MQFTPLCVLALAGSALATQPQVHKREPQLLDNIANKIGEGTGAINTVIRDGSGVAQTIGNLLGTAAGTRVADATRALNDGAAQATNAAGAIGNIVANPLVSSLASLAATNTRLNPLLPQPTPTGGLRTAPISPGAASPTGGLPPSNGTAAGSSGSSTTASYSAVPAAGVIFACTFLAMFGYM